MMHKDKTLALLFLLILVLNDAVARSPRSRRDSRDSDSFVFPNDGRGAFFHSKEEAAMEEDGLRHVKNSYRPRNVRGAAAAAAAATLGGRNVAAATAGGYNVVAQQHPKLADFADQSLCSEADFCEDPSEYPTEVVSELIAKLDNIATNGRHRQFFSQRPQQQHGDDEDEDALVQHFFAQPPRLPRPQTDPKLAMPISSKRISSNNSSNNNNNSDNNSSSNEDEDDDVDLALDKDTAEEQDEDVIAAGRSSIGAASAAPGNLTTTTAKPASTTTADPPAAGGGGGNGTEQQKPPPPPKPEKVLQETPMCRSLTSYIYPKRAQNKDHKYRFIINAPEKDYIQVVRIEKCHFPGGECSLGGGSSGFSFSDFNIRTVCRQKYTYRRMLALNEDGEDEVDLFKFPSCCLCYQVEESLFVGQEAPLVQQPADVLGRRKYVNVSSFESEVAEPYKTPRKEDSE